MNERSSSGQIVHKITTQYSYSQNNINFFPLLKYDQLQKKNTIEFFLLLCISSQTDESNNI